MGNFRFNLEQVYKKGLAEEAKKLKTEKKKIPKSFYNEKETAIYISCSMYGYVKTNTGLKIKPMDFDVSTQSVKTRDNKSTQLQLLLNTMRDRCLIDYMEAKRNGKNLTKLDVKKIMEEAVGNQPENQEKPLDCIDILNEFIKWKGERVEEKTLYRYKSLQKILIQYEKKQRKPLLIDEFDGKFADEFSLFLINEYNYAHNTVVKYLKLLKGFSKYCFDYGYSESIRFNQIKATEHSTSVFVLSADEIDKIASLEIESQSLNEVRDVFLMLAYTGQRYSDIIGLRWQDIVKEGNFTYWKVFQKKTKDSLATRVPLLPEALELVNKRKLGHENERVFNVISNQKMNSNLKKVARQANIKGKFTIVRKQGNKTIKIVKDRAECVTSHIGRKSFITNALIKGMSPDMIRRISGHSNYDAMIPYINIADENVATQLLSTHLKK